MNETLYTSDEIIRMKRVADAVYNYLGISTVEEFVAWYRDLRAALDKDEPDGGFEAVEPEEWKR